MLWNIRVSAAEFVISGDINTDCLVDSNLKKQLASFLTSYSLSVAHS